MKKGVLWLGLSCLMIAAMLLSSCKTTPATTTTTTTTTTTATTAVTTAATTTTTATDTVKDFQGKLVEKPQYGGTLVTPFSGDPASLDPGDSGTANSGGYMGFVFETLGIGDWAMGGSGTGEVSYENFSPDFTKCGIGSLAESWEMPDPTTLTVHIRQGIHFQNKAPANGRELTAEDVRYCYQRYWNSATSPWDVKPYLASIATTDKWTVVVKFKQPYVNSIEDIVFGTALVYPPEAIATYGNLKDWHNWVGTGPFIWADYVAGSSARFVKNSNYWCTDEIIPGNPLPYTDAVTVLIIIDTNTQLAALRTGKIDFQTNISRDSHKALQETSPQLQYKAVLQPGAYPLVIMRLDKAPFNDLRVRQALLMSIDFQGIIKNYLGGEGIPLIFPVLPTYGAAYTPLEEMPADVQELYSYNVTKAKELLTAAGYPTGFDTEIQSFPGMDDRCLILANYWKSIGVRATLVTLDPGSTITKLFTRSYTGIATLTAGIALPLVTMQWFTSTHVWDLGNYFNPEYDALIAKLMKTTDPDEQISLTKQAVLMLYRSAGFFTFPGQDCYIYWQPWVKHYHGEISLGDGRGQAQVYSRLWIDQKMKKSMGY